MKNKGIVINYNISNRIPNSLKQKTTPLSAPENALADMASV